MCRPTKYGFDNVTFDNVSFGQFSTTCRSVSWHSAAWFSTKNRSTAVEYTIRKKQTTHHQNSWNYVLFLFSNKVVRILLQPHMYIQDDWGIGTGNEPFVGHGCRVRNCYLTTDHAFMGADNQVIRLSFLASGFQGYWIKNGFNFSVFFHEI
jgi:hypothetical protein